MASPWLRFPNTPTDMVRGASMTMRATRMHAPVKVPSIVNGAWAFSSLVMSVSRLATPAVGVSLSPWFTPGNTLGCNGRGFFRIALGSCRQTLRPEWVPSASATT